MPFLAPFFLAGIAFLTFPWFIHQIRRPIAEPVRFSSLMFIPNIPKEVIERRKIQHILLMLLRMLLLLLLAMAFARPYKKMIAVSESAGEPGRHVILLDVSYSMGTEDWFVEAKREAEKVLDSIGYEDRVGVIAFADFPTVLAPLHAESDPSAGEKQRAEAAIKAAELTEQATAYVPALQRAQDMLQSVGMEEEEVPDRLVIHLISDFQAVGVKDEYRGWKLSPRISLHPIEVSGSGARNQSIQDISVGQTKGSELRIQGKVKNWSKMENGPSAVRLLVGGREVARQLTNVQPGHASQVSFAFSVEDFDDLTGWLELEEDLLTVDNRRYFAWNRPRKKNVLIVADENTGQRWPSASFVKHALPQEEDSPWTTESVSQEELPGALEDAGRLPDLVIGCGLNGVDEMAAAAILRYAESGGQVLLTLNASMTDQELNDYLFPRLGLKSAGTRYEEILEYRFGLWSWVDLDHPVFYPFRGSRLNDFSDLRFHNFHRLEIASGESPGEGISPIRILARFEEGDSAAEFPAMIEIRMGKGRIIVWAFSLNLDWSNIAKSTKFVPLVHETVTYLCGGAEEQRSWQVGQRIPGLPAPLNQEGSWIVQTPEEEDDQMTTAEQAVDGVLSRAGFLQWESEGPEQAVHGAFAVNVEASEADPSRIATDEFVLKLASNPGALGDEESGTAVWGTRIESEVRKEFGGTALAFLFVFLLVESWYSSRLK